jgi:hypothetical protein
MARHQCGIPTIHTETEASVEGRTREPTKRRPRPLPHGGEAFEEPEPEPTERLLARHPQRRARDVWLGRKGLVHNGEVRLERKGPPSSIEWPWR